MILFLVIPLNNALLFSYNIIKYNIINTIIIVKIINATFQGFKKKKTIRTS